MTNWLIRMLKTPKTQIGFLLTLIFITAFFNNPSLKVILVFALSVGSTLLFDLLFVKLRRIKPFFPSASLVTGSIVGLLTGPNLTWYVPVMVGIIAMLSKNFIRFSNRHIFNPAGFGLLVGAIIFGNVISWWAVSFQQFFPLRGISLRETIPFIILLSPALVSLARMKRYRTTLSFIVAYIIINTILDSKFARLPDGQVILNSFFDPTVLFFSIVMLPEPLTSPNNHTKQILFGIFVALISLVISSSTFNSIDPLIFSLLLGNLVFFKLR